MTPHGDTSNPADRLAAGDRQAFADLYDRLAPRMFGAALSMTGSTPEAEDAVQDVFVELARSRYRLPGIVDLEAYVFTMLYHVIGRRRRRQAVERRAVERIGADRRSAGGLVQEPGMPADDDLAAAVARLPTAQREVVLLKIDGGLTFAQIAAVLGTNINTAAGRYRAALDKLRAAVTPPEAAR